MFRKLNYQYVLSYLGLIPFILIIFHNYLLFQINDEILKNFVIYYTIIISVFIGAINWDLSQNIDNSKIFYGFLPSLFAVILIICNLYNFKFDTLILTLISILSIQLFLDYIFIYLKSINKKSYYFLRIPLTLIIILSLLIIRSQF